MMIYLGLLLALFLEYVRPGGYLPIINAIKLNSMIPLLVLFLTIFSKEGLDNKRVFADPITKWMLLFLFLLLMSVVTADVTTYSLNILTGVLGYIFLFYIIARLATTLERLQGVMAVLVLSHVIVLALNPALITSPDVRSYIYGHTFLGDGNDFALSVSVILPLCVYLFLESKKRLFKLVYLGSLFLLMLGVIGTQSRGASLALVAVALYLWVMGKRKVAGLVALIVVGIGIVFYAPDAYFERMESVANYEEDGSAMGRVIAWKAALRMVEKYPLTGVSTGHFAIKLGTEFRPPEWGERNLPWLTAHSMYFLIIGELGLPGITFFLVSIIGNFFRNNRLLRRASDSRQQSVQNLARLFLMINGSWIAFAVGGAFLSVAYYPHLYVLSGILVAANFILEREIAGGESAPLAKPEVVRKSPNASRRVL